MWQRLKSLDLLCQSVCSGIKKEDMAGSPRLKTASRLWHNRTSNSLLISGYAVFALSNKLKLYGHIKILLGMCWLMSNGSFINTKCLYSWIHTYSHGTILAAQNSSAALAVPCPLMTLKATWPLWTRLEKEKVMMAFFVATSNIRVGYLPPGLPSRKLWVQSEFYSMTFRGV